MLSTLKSLAKEMHGLNANGCIWCPIHLAAQLGGGGRIDELCQEINPPCYNLKISTP